MTYTLCCGIRPADLALAKGAASWVEAFHPGVRATFENATVLLASDDYDQPHLRLLWKTGLLNERLHEQGASQRAAMLAGLVR
ncbi:hypothetical protein [Flavisphingomonas formosensis]|uniref:hypothetical protein n=1 Tax=Flavisphingomonas formosensis TaxID=861534 RepID=UPI0012FAB55A|nr:hypothetical protein [Sphingomonas formosensis]